MKKADNKTKIDSASPVVRAGDRAVEVFALGSEADDEDEDDDEGAAAPAAEEKPRKKRPLAAQGEAPDQGAEAPRPVS